MSDDWALGSNTVEFRNEERRAANSSEQETLFDPGQTAPPKCSRGCTHKQLCAFDADLEHGIILAGKRPKSCLNAPDPRTMPFPEGY